MTILGVDPGINGALVLTDGVTLKTWPMPIIFNGKDKDIDFDGVHDILFKVLESCPEVHAIIERAVPMAMGAKSAFNYGRGFAALQIAVAILEVPVTYVEPQRWAKEMHEGISLDLKPKAKSLIAARRLYPKLVKMLPTNTKGKLHDGPVDALLIAGYGLRVLRASQKERIETAPDFY